MHCHWGTNNRAPQWTFTDPCKPEARPGTREESASPAWLAAPTMNARNTTKVYIWRLDTVCGLKLYRKCHSSNTPGKGIITLESNPSRGQTIITIKLEILMLSNLYTLLVSISYLSIVLIYSLICSWSHYASIHYFRNSCILESQRF